LTPPEANFYFFTAMIAKNRKLLGLLVGCVTLLGLGVAHPDIITMMYCNYPYPTPDSPNVSATPIQLAAGQTAKILYGTGIDKLYFTTPGNDAQNPLTVGDRVSGPATIYLDPSTQSGWTTVEVRSQTFPPDKTMILGAGTNSASISLECSTNLVNWTPCTNGFYGGSNSVMFFRITGTVTSPN
jgi:hypothetical protein